MTMKAQPRQEDVREEFERLFKEAMKQPGVAVAQETYEAYRRYQESFDRFSQASEIPATVTAASSCE